MTLSPQTLAAARDLASKCHRERRWQVRILAIDPGNKESAYVLYDTESQRVLCHSKCDNTDIIEMIDAWHDADNWEGPENTLVIEQVACMGMAVGAEVFETVFWSGRFAQAWSGDFHRVKRHQVKMHLCGNMRAKDGNIRQAILDRYGGKVAAIGKKASPGPLYGLAGDEWAALAVAITFAETSPSSSATSPHSGGADLLAADLRERLDWAQQRIAGLEKGRVEG